MMLFGRKKSVAVPKPDTTQAVPAETPVPPPPPVSPAGAVPPAAAPAVPPPRPVGSAAAAPAPAVPGQALRTPFTDKGHEMTVTPPKPPIAPSLPGNPLKTDIPRRMDLPGVSPRPPQGLSSPSAPAMPAAAPVPLAAPPAPPRAADPRRLIVGRDISLSGEIGSCDALVVEGSVEAKLPDGRSIEITETGLFKGAVEIDEADIGGRFEGSLVVRGRLTVRSTGRIHGSIRYGVLSVESGGQLVGDIQVVSAAPKETPAAIPVPAPVPVTPDTVD